jgi:hypothetical protein
MDDDKKTFADGVKTQTSVSMIETELTDHPKRSQVVRAPRPKTIINYAIRPTDCTRCLLSFVGWNWQVRLPGDILAARTDCSFGAVEPRGVVSPPVSVSKPLCSVG